MIFTLFHISQYLIISQLIVCKKDSPILEIEKIVSGLVNRTNGIEEGLNEQRNATLALSSWLENTDTRVLEMVPDLHIQIKQLNND